MKTNGTHSKAGYIFLDALSFALGREDERKAMLSHVLMAHPAGQTNRFGTAGNGQHQVHPGSDAQRLRHFCCQAIRTNVGASSVYYARVGFSNLQKEVEVSRITWDAISELLNSAIALFSQLSFISRRTNFWKASWVPLVEPSIDVSWPLIPI